MFNRWFPWKYLIRRAARKYGFLDPITLMARLRQFSQPAEVSEPVELIRAGALFHARGLINTRAIQHNLDWVWPYWIEQQFDPKKSSFIPRAFSVTHINLTHRNWTAVGSPGCDAFPIIDPRGLVTPLWDGWSIDAWILPAEAPPLIPSRAADDQVKQRCNLQDGDLTVTTRIENGRCTLNSECWVAMEGDSPVCHIRYKAGADSNAKLVLTVRPCNPEGISLVHSIKLLKDQRQWRIEGKHTVELSAAPEKHFVSAYKDGDVFMRLKHKHESAAEPKIKCNVGLATAAALYEIDPDSEREVELKMNLASDPQINVKRKIPTSNIWDTALESMAHLSVPDQRIEDLYNNAVHTLVLMSPDWAYPGPYTYKRFWYRDAAMMIQGLLDAGLDDRARQVIDKFPEKQTLSGFFHSQEGEWDANGEVLWVAARYCRLTRTEPDKRWLKMLRLGGDWINGKILTKAEGKLHQGLLPAGFSAEHFGNIDYYYWDDFWAAAGLMNAADLVEADCPERAVKWRKTAENLMTAIWESLQKSAHIRDVDAFPASPYRRMDAGAIGSLAAGYPLRLVDRDCPQLLNTVEYLLNNSFVNGAFYQNMVHSGLNIYLSLHVAQVLLRNEDWRFYDIVKTVRDLASPTGNWPEAIHPLTGGGCMGDGQHAWAAGEWVTMLRNMFLREEDNRLILASGIPDEWLCDVTKPISFGPTLTPHGKITVTIKAQEGGGAAVEWEGEWFNKEPEIEVRNVEASGGYS
ncbi:MAG: hypothetical protein R6V56_01840 [Lentisphaeria bacterium]